MHLRRPRCRFIVGDVTCTHPGDQLLQDSFQVVLEQFAQAVTTVTAAHCRHMTLTVVVLQEEEEDESETDICVRATTLEASLLARLRDESYCFSWIMLVSANPPPPHM